MPSLANTSANSASLEASKSIPEANRTTTFQYSLAAIILGASAGLTLYTKRTSHMLNQLNRAAKNAQERRGPPQFGPRTKVEWEKMRNRWEPDDL
jgi:hypothetical protein